ncbi:hypothetical protein J437_LFUL016628 [Ladona fulva]|uniref:Uncharacterized protein n=1 Tax=Ladona fulva TaxID=123851 RepID=A0A8K0P5B1_LADFU|nr:hypothetical protein J437_LFUL016628 [Ladona fulva]
MKKGDVAAFRKGKMLVLRWKDKKEVTLLSTVHRGSRSSYCTHLLSGSSSCCKCLNARHLLLWRASSDQVSSRCRSKQPDGEWGGELTAADDEDFVGVVGGDVVVVDDGVDIGGIGDGGILPVAIPSRPNIYSSKYSNGTMTSSSTRYIVFNHFQSSSEYFPYSTIPPKTSIRVPSTTKPYAAQPGGFRKRAESICPTMNNSDPFDQQFTCWIQEKENHQVTNCLSKVAAKLLDNKVAAVPMNPK